MAEQPFSETNEFEADDAAASRPAKPFGRWALVVIILIGAGLLLAKMYNGPDSAMAYWGHDWDEALAESSRGGKPMLVLFTADWCPPCQAVKKDVLSDPDVVARLKADFSLLKIDLTRRGGPNDRIAETYSVRAVPTWIVFNAKGEQIGRLTGAGPKDAMCAWFEKAKVRAQ